MKMDGITLNSRGVEPVYFYRGEVLRRTVYSLPDQWRFFIKLYGEFKEVYHKTFFFGIHTNCNFSRDPLKNMTADDWHQLVDWFEDHQMGDWVENEDKKVFIIQSKLGTYLKLNPDGSVAGYTDDAWNAMMFLRYDIITEKQRRA